MPVPNTRVACVGTVRADKAFDVVEISKEAAQKAADKLYTEADRARREIDRTLRKARLARR